MEEAYRQPGHAVAFSGRSQVSRQFPNKSAKKFLSGVDSYTRHREFKRPRDRNPVYVYNTREILQIDLADVSNLSEWNNNTNFLFLALDTFSRKAWIRPLPNKSAPVVANAMKSVLDEIGGNIIRLLSDNGKEFLNRIFYDLLKKANIKHTTSTAEIKAPHVERFTRTLKRLIGSYLTERETRKYIDQLDNLLTTYNSRWHRSIEMSPDEAFKPENRDAVLAILNRTRYGPIALKRTKGESEFKVGDLVRLSHVKTTFRKGHEETATGEYFRIKNILNTLPITQYEITNYNGDETIKGAFYASELQLVDNPVFKVEKTIRSKVVNGKLKHFVKWLHFGDEHNSWINDSDIVDRF